jgi:hypothetical protein
MQVAQLAREDREHLPRKRPLTLGREFDKESTREGPRVVLAGELCGFCRVVIGGFRHHPLVFLLALPQSMFFTLFNIVV